MHRKPSGQGLRPEGTPQASDGPASPFVRSDIGATALDRTRKWVEIVASDPNLGGLIPPTAYPFAADKVGDLGVRFADLTGTGRVFMLVGFEPAGAGTAPQRRRGNGA